MAVAAMSSSQRARPAPAVRHAPPTPPMSSTFDNRRPADYPLPVPGPSRVALPPIAYLDRTLSSMQPLTPPDDGAFTSAGETTRLPPILHGYSDDPFLSSSSAKQHHLYEIPALHESEPRREHQLAPIHYHQPTPPVCVWDSAPHLIDWLDFTRNRSAHFIAEKTCEMICYLWFASSPVTRRSTPSSRKEDGGEHKGDASMSYPSPHHSPSSPSRVASVTPGEASSSRSPTRSPPSTLQLVATPSFISFMQKLLETTQVSQSVIVLSLHYIYRLKERNQFTPAQRGSEFRIAVAGLMMANKFLDDNTYTNKTWSEVSGIELEEINRMEREFLLGVDFNLYVDKPTYESWLNLLKGLVSAKERDSMSSSNPRNSRDLGSRRRDAKKVSAATPRYHHQQQQQRATRNQPPAAVAQTQHQPSSYNPTTSYATPTRLPPLSRAVPTAYYYPYTSSNSQFPTTTSTTHAPHSAPQSSSAFTNGYGRARSSSPTSVGYPDVPMHDDLPASSYPPASSHNRAPASHIHPSTNKRTAEAAFSPTSASFGAHLPSKRPLSMSVTIPETMVNSGGPGSYSSTSGSAGYENSPLDSLSSFSRMSLVEGSPEKRQQQQQQQARYHSQTQQQPVTSTLVAPYSYQVNTKKQSSQPQDLYFYTLASSPMEAPVPTRSRAGMRKQGNPATSSEDAEADRDQVMVQNSVVDDRAVVIEEDDDEIIETDGDEWERNQRERDAHGERRRTRKAKLMRWSSSSSSSSVAGAGGGVGVGGVSHGGYAYDYSREWSAYRQHQQQQEHRSVQQQQQSQSSTSGYATSPVAASNATQHSGYYHHHAVQSAHVPSVNVSTHHPVSRAYIPVVQSASTSPAGGVVYVQRAGEVGYANANSYGAYPSSQSYSTTSASATQSAHVEQYGYPVRDHAHQAAQAQQQPQSQPRQPQSWYSHNQGGSVSYHPSPVQDKAEYARCYVPMHDDRQAAGYGAPSVRLPHQHDNVWTRPPVVLAKRVHEDGDAAVVQRGRGARGYLTVATESRSQSQSERSDSDALSVSEEDEDEDESVVEDAIPSAPFANAGPAGVHVPFGSEYAKYQGYHAHHAYQPYQQAHGYTTVQSQPQQRDVYTASGQYAPPGSVFTPAYHASYAQHQPTSVSKGGLPLRQENYRGEQQQWAAQRLRGGEY